MTHARVLVTGGSGFVGRWALASLVERGADVHSIQRGALEAVPGVTAHVADLRDRKRMQLLMVDLRPTHLLHFAWIATPGVYVTSLENPHWLQWSLRLVEVFLAHGGERVVVAGTSAEYDWTAGMCSELKTPCRPATLYAACKHAQYEVLERLAAQEKFSFAEGRLFWAYGPGESRERLVPSMIRASARNEPFQLHYPKQVRDYMHVADAGAAFSALLASDVQGAVNIGSGEGVALDQLGEIIGQEMGRGLSIETPVERVTDPAPLVVADTNRLVREVGFAPRYPLREGIRDTVAWWRGRGRMALA
jgi:nucleoside-diphosphate-sugar epimerase